MDKFTVPLREGAALVGLSESTVRRRYVYTGRINLYDLGGRAGSVLVSELRAAVEADCAAQRADPSQKRTRNAGGAHNPWGRAGKPRSAAKGKRS